MRGDAADIAPKHLPWGRRLLLSLIQHTYEVNQLGTSESHINIWWLWCDAWAH